MTHIICFYQKCIHYLGTVEKLWYFLNIVRGASFTMHFVLMFNSKRIKHKQFTYALLVFLRGIFVQNINIFIFFINLKITFFVIL